MSSDVFRRCDRYRLWHLKFTPSLEGGGDGVGCVPTYVGVKVASPLEGGGDVVNGPKGASPLEGGANVVGFVPFSNIFV